MMARLLWLFLLTAFVSCASDLNLPATSNCSVDGKISYLEDPNAKLTFSKIRDIEFSPHERANINFGFTRSVYWFRIDLRQFVFASHMHWWLKIDYPLLERIDAYLLNRDGKLVKHQRMGTSQPYASREIASNNFITALPLDKAGGSVLYLRVQTQSSMQLPIEIIDTDTLTKELENNHFLVGVYYGIFVIILLYNIVLWVNTGDMNYFRYLIFLVSFILWQLSFDGHGIQYLWADNVWMIQHGSGVFIASSAFFALYFSRNFLDTARYAPIADKIILFFMAISLALVFASTILPYGTVIPFNALLGALMPAVALSAGLIVIRKGYKAAQFYVAGWSSLLIATIIFAFNKFNLIPSFYGVNHVQQLGSAIEMIFLSMALAHRVYLLQREYIQKLNHLNETLSEDVRIALHKAREKDRLFVQQSRLAAMGEMIEQIAHQWRQPLNTLALINQDMYVKTKLGICDDTCFEKNHGLVDEHLQYLSKTIDDFRHFYKTDKSRQVESVDHLIQDALRLSEVFLKYAKIKTEVQSTATLHVNLAKNEMIQVLMNLIKNAHDAIVEQGNRNGMILITVEDDQSEIKLTVEDNAGGIAPNVMDRIFDIYFTTKDPEQGTGLGLHMSKYIIEESFGGRIWVENVASGGARFVVILPAVKPIPE